MANPRDGDGGIQQHPQEAHQDNQEAGKVLPSLSPGSYGGEREIGLFSELYWR
jgi:hypothetical protein